MPVVTAHPPGIFCWPELATSDAAAAGRFYSALFDWEVDTLHTFGERYSVFRIGEEHVAAGFGMPLEGSWTAPRWNSHVSVENADQVADRAVELGGTIVKPAADVGQAGRVVGIEDPTGATVFLWQPIREIGAHRLNEPGALCWTELITTDMEKAQEFYTALFGWTARAHRYGEYVEFLRGEDVVAGMLRTPPGRGSEGSHWLPYFAAADVDDIVQIARRHFGRILGRPMDLPLVGRSAVLRDPQGATFGVFGVNEAA